jgi:hypothetical protein
MTKIWTVIKREYIQIVRTKGFIIGTVLGPVLMAALVAVPVILAVATGGEKRTPRRRLGPDLRRLRRQIGRLRSGIRTPLRARGVSAGRTWKPSGPSSATGPGQKLSGYIYLPADLWRERPVCRPQRLSFDETSGSRRPERRRRRERLKEGLDPAKSPFTRRINVKMIKVTAAANRRTPAGLSPWLTSSSSSSI